MGKSRGGKNRGISRGLPAFERGVVGVLGSFPETSGEEGIPGYFRGRGKTSGDGGGLFGGGQGWIEDCGPIVSSKSSLLLQFLPKLEMLDNTKGSICVLGTLPYSLPAIPSYL